ncbi:uncharacterized protein LOC116023541 [Ipomoea triloba]|uniref:uncharacterized protein LOC116023541 n=1 Tax=Ipomoea triloba TaxID=35885 RepID=UPI00125DDF30|nr:uncharacterized protein LOC116023541 [Ipomoea triloba]
MKWTVTLHSNFMDCVADSGGNIKDATAGEILRRMRIREPGLELTESQVRSHLQKIRNFKTKELKRMNTKARIHQQYLMQTSLWGTRAVLDEWGFFLRECDNLYRSRYDDDDDDNDNDISDSENNNQQVEIDGDNNEEWKTWIASPERSELDTWMEMMMDDYPPKI